MTTSCSRQLVVCPFSRKAITFLLISHERSSSFGSSSGTFVRGMDAATPRDIKKCMLSTEPIAIHCPSARCPLCDCLIARSGIAVGLHSCAVWTSHAISRGRRPGPGGRGRARPCRPRSIRRLTASEVRHGDRCCRYGSLESHPCHLVRVCCWYETRTPRIALFSEVAPLFVSSPRRNTSHKP